jgi:hypothetical protein
VVAIYWLVSMEMSHALGLNPPDAVVDQEGPIRPPSLGSPPDAPVGGESHRGDGSRTGLPKPPDI